MKWCDELACEHCATVLVAGGRAVATECQCRHYNAENKWWFDPTKQYGGLIKLHPEDFPTIEADQRRFIEDQAAMFVPDGTKLEYIILPPTEPDPNGYLGWKSIPVPS